MPKRFCNDDTMVWIFLKCKTQTWKFMCECLPGKRIVCSASKVTTCSSIYSKLCKQGDNIFMSNPNMPSCCWSYAPPARWQHINHISMLLSNKMTVTIWLYLLWFYLRIWLLPPWILPSAAIAFPASVTKKLPCQERWDDSHFLIYHPCRHLLVCKIIVVPYVDTNAKVTDFLPFCSIGISMYQKITLPYTLFLTYLPQAYSLLERYRQTDG